MRFIVFSKRKIKLVIITIVFFIVLLNVSSVFGIKDYYTVDFTTGLVTATTLNVRSGPGTSYKVIATAKKNEYIRVFAGIGDWYIVQVEGDYIGAVSKKYVKGIYKNTSSNTTNSSSSKVTTTQTSGITSDEQEVFDLINKQRTNNGLSALKIDNELQRVAKIKAQDMVNNNYFSHNSPTYGTPFEMIKSFGISYKTAGENIAGNSTNSGAVTAWMNSEGHKANILNSSFNYTGIGVVNSKTYGKVYVQMFIGK